MSVDSNTDILTIAETKLDCSFPTAQFLVDRYKEPAHNDMSKYRESRQHAAPTNSCIILKFLILGAKHCHDAKPLPGKLCLPKLLVPTQRYCTTMLQAFFPCQTT